MNDEENGLKDIAIAIRAHAESIGVGDKHPGAIEAVAMALGATPGGGLTVAGGLYAIAEAIDRLTEADYGACAIASAIDRLANSLEKSGR
jgi:hypothetical protein